MTNDPIFAFANHVTSTRLDDIPDDAIRAAKTFILDTLGVGISGGSGPMTAELVATAAKMGSGNDATIWGTGQKTARRPRRPLQRLSGPLSGI